MKKNLSPILLIVAALFSAIHAGAQIDNLTNLSPEWIRSGVRNASLDGTDVAIYNPGGVSRLKPGFHLTVGNQFSFRNPKHEYTLDLGGGPVNYAYQQDGNDLLTPNINFSYNKDKWAVFGGLNIVAGGGEANFPNGSISTDLLSLNTVIALNGLGLPYTNGKNAYFKASAFDYSTSLGGSYSVNEKFSFGMMVRYVVGVNKSEAGVTIEDATDAYPDFPFAFQSEDNASGIGVVLGMNVKPSDKLNLAVRYESQVSLEYETDSIRDDFGFIADGEKFHHDLPGVLAFGAQYKLSEKTKLMFDFNYYFQRQADWGKTTLQTNTNTTTTYETSQLAGDASTYALAVEYKINPKFLWSLGVNYSLFSFKDQAGYFTNLGAYEIAPGNNVSISTGFAFNPVENIRINAGFTQAIYSDQKIKALNYSPFDVDVKTSNSISIIGLGVDFLF